MARVFKGGAVDDGQFPMPPDPRGGGQPRPGEAPHVDPTFAGIEPAEMQHALGELHQMIGMISGMRPAVQELSEQLRTGARQQGYDEGRAQAQAEVASVLQNALNALTGAGRERHQIAQAHEPALAELALQIARKVIGAHLEADPSIVQRIVAETIAELEPSTALEVRVHPDDVQLIDESRQELERLVQGDGRITVTPDPKVDRGGVILVSPVGEVDARIETKLSVLETAFTAQRRTAISIPKPG